MKVLNVRNVCEALPTGVNYLKQYGRLENSRAGKVLVAPEPVTTVYECPWERVVFSAKRDANPFFHLMESLHMLAGRQDAAFLNTFIKDFGERFAEPDGRIHDAYGYRWRKHFSYDESLGFGLDQLSIIVSILRKDPFSRQAVLQMWDPVVDLGVPGLKTRPCNTVAYFRIQDKRLEMTVSCRSNDIIFGAYGANAVHFSILQEYLAAAIGVKVGVYYQVSNNYHAYTDVFDKYADADLNDQRYPLVTTPLVDDPVSFLVEVEDLLSGKVPAVFKNRFLHDTAWPLLQIFRAGKQWDSTHIVAAPDWRMASEEWLLRRKKK